MPTTAGVSKYFARGNRIVFAGWGFGSVFRDLHRELQSTHCPATGKTQNPLMATSCGFESHHRHQTEFGRAPRSRLSFFILPQHFASCTQLFCFAAHGRNGSYFVAAHDWGGIYFVTAAQIKPGAEYTPDLFPACMSHIILDSSKYPEIGWNGFIQTTKVSEA